MRAVLDTNVLISALIVDGKSKLLFTQAVHRQFELVTSSKILAEFQRITKEPKIKKYIDQQDILAFLKAIEEIADVVEVKSRFKGAQDPADDIILRTAVDGLSDVIVTGDKGLLSLGTFRGIKILTIGQMLELLNE
jgi:uncharacterized protein